MVVPLCLLDFCVLLFATKNIRTNEAETKIKYQPLHNINPLIGHKYCSLEFKAQNQPHIRTYINR